MPFATAEPAGVPAELLRSRELAIALAGNPNSGKTSLFNRLTGGNQHVGNYPGVTVEKTWGDLRGPGGPMKVVDLPGTYSLSALSEEERVARRYLIEERPDVVVDVIDASNLERNLHLAVQLLELELNLVLALNMADVARGQGQILDAARLGALLGAPVVETVASRGGGVEELKQACRRASAPQERVRVDYGEDLEREIAQLEALLAAAPALPLPRRYAAVKLLEGDAELGEIVRAAHPDFAAVEALLDQAAARLWTRYKDSPEVLIADRRYGFAAGIAREVTLRGVRLDRITQSERADAILTHRVLGLPLFLLIIYGLFWLTFTLGDPFMGLIEAGFARLSGAVSAIWPAGSLGWARSLIADGVIGGVGGVLVFLPNVVLLFLGIGVLEDTGYMARSAFLMDRVMHRFGLHGKSFIPMLVGFGCTIPAIMATRTLPSRRDRLVTMLVLPFISCSARLPIYLLIIPAFFAPAWQAPVLWGIYMLGIAAGLLVARLLSRTLFRDADSPFVMELPPYRMPTARSILLNVRLRTGLYLRKAGTLILGISVVLWILMNVPRPERFAVDQPPAGGTALSESQVQAARAAETLEYSVAGRIGRALEPVMAPLGFDWRITTSFLGAFAAKEVFVAQMAIIFRLEDAGAGDVEGLRAVLARHYTQRQALSILVFALLATPCMATFAVTRRESGRWSYAALQWGGLTALAYLLSLIVYQAGGLLAA